MKVFLLGLVTLLSCCLQAQVEVSASTSKPWTYWWWMGSAVDREGIARELRDFAASGLGGVHIVPIYGAKGYEDRYLDFFSEEWLEMVQYAEEEAAALGLGVDLSLASGWPYGGPWVGAGDVAMKGELVDIPLLDASSVTVDLPRIKADNGFTEVLSAFLISEHEVIDLTEELGNSAVKMSLPPGDWELRVFGMRPTGQQVKRAGPGGEGPVVDYLNARAVGNYLEHFDSILAFTEFPISPRAFHHESYETYDAGVTYGLLDSFYNYHGYRLIDFVPFKPGPLATSDDSLLMHDIRLLVDHLLQQSFAAQWTQWTAHRGAQSRYQAHGSPANLLDLYARATIPETEAFGCSGFPIPGLFCDPDYNADRFERPNPLMMKFASSPAHLLGKPLVSGEVGTWLANHFKLSLRQAKPEIDQLFVGGANHIFYQGSTYSPPEAGFPGWLNYAASNFGASAAFSAELPLLNGYVTRCQEKLQTARPDNDVLLYFTIQDYWAKTPLPVLRYLDVHDYGDWFEDVPFGRVANLLQDAGFAFDYVSDRQLRELEVTESGAVRLPGDGGTYRTIVVPRIDYIPHRTAAALRRLTEEGATVVYDGQLPTNYATMQYYQSEESPGRFLRGSQPRGEAIVSKDLVRDLETRVAGVRRESLRSSGLNFIRKATPAGQQYFVVNLGGTPVSGPLGLAADYRWVTVTDPLSGRSGVLRTSDSFDLDVPPGQSYFLETHLTRPELPPWESTAVVETVSLAGPWEVTFAPGRSDAPAGTFVRDSLTSWTEWGNDTLAYYAGRATYRSTFRADTTGSPTYRLAFDRVHESAEVMLNGVSQGTVWAFPNTLHLRPADLRAENTLEIVVRNLDANYLRKYDGEHPEWKNFHDVNFVGISYRPFSAEWWELMDSGLVGGVTLERRLPVSNREPAAGR